MAWSIKCDKGGDCGAWIEDNGVAHFPKNTGYSITYTITYTDKDGNCGSTTITQPGGCSGGGGDTCTGITITKETGTVPVPIDGGSLTFSHSNPPTGECITNSTTPFTKNDDIDIILQRGFNCTQFMDEPILNGDHHVVITNDSDYYLPFNGAMKYNDCKWYFRKSFTVYQNYYYGRTKDSEQDSNYMLKPHCKFEYDAEFESGKGGGAYMNFSLLKQMTIDVAEGDYQDYRLHNEGIDEGTGASFSLNGGTLYVTIDNRAAYIDIYGFTSEDMEIGYKTFDDPATGRFKVIPINLYRIVNNDWEGYKPVGTPINNNGN